MKGGGSDTRFEVVFTTGAIEALVQGQSHVYLRGNLLVNATVTVEPKGAVSVSGACGTDCEPDVHEIILSNQMAHTRVTLVVRRAMASKFSTPGGMMGPCRLCCRRHLKTSTGKLRC